MDCHGGSTNLLWCKGVLNIKNTLYVPSKSDCKSSANAVNFTQIRKIYWMKRYVYLSL